MPVIEIIEELGLVVVANNSNVTVSSCGLLGKDSSLNITGGTLTTSQVLHDQPRDGSAGYTMRGTKALINTLTVPWSDGTIFSVYDVDLSIDYSTFGEDIYVGTSAGEFIDNALGVNNISIRDTTFTGERMMLSAGRFNMSNFKGGNLYWDNPKSVNSTRVTDVSTLYRALSDIGLEDSPGKREVFLEPGTYDLQGADFYIRNTDLLLGGTGVDVIITGVNMYVDKSNVTLEDIGIGVTAGGRASIDIRDSTLRMTNTTLGTVSVIAESTFIDSSSNVYSTSATATRLSLVNSRLNSGNDAFGVREGSTIVTDNSTIMLNSPDITAPTGEATSFIGYVSNSDISIITPVSLPIDNRLVTDVGTSRVMPFNKLLPTGNYIYVEGKSDNVFNKNFSPSTTGGADTYDSFLWNVNGSTTSIVMPADLEIPYTMGDGYNLAMTANVRLVTDAGVPFSLTKEIIVAYDGLGVMTTVSDVDTENIALAGVTVSLDITKTTDIFMVGFTIGNTGILPVRGSIKVDYVITGYVLGQ